MTHASRPQLMKHVRGERAARARRRSENDGGSFLDGPCWHLPPREGESELMLSISDGGVPRAVQAMRPRACRARGS